MKLITKIIIITSLLYILWKEFDLGRDGGVQSNINNRLVVKSGNSFRLKREKGFHYLVDQVGDEWGFQFTVKRLNILKWARWMLAYGNMILPAMHYQWLIAEQRRKDHEGVTNTDFMHRFNDPDGVAKMYMIAVCWMVRLKPLLEHYLILNPCLLLFTNKLLRIALSKASSLYARFRSWVHIFLLAALIPVFSFALIGNDRVPMELFQQRQTISTLHS